VNTPACDGTQNNETGTTGASVPVTIPDKRYFRIGEVCEITGIKQHVLRYWESEFPALRPPRTQSRQRLYRREDVENVLKIKKLLKEQGFTIHGAKKALSRHDGNQRKEQPPVAERLGNSSCNEGRFEPGQKLLEVKDQLQALKKMLEE